MEAYFEDGKSVIYHGDCRHVMSEMETGSIDAIVTDPPYELGFMGKSWDSSRIAYDVAVWSKCLRLLKPGGHLLSFGGSRTYHRMACAIEDAGFEVRDQIMWIYGSGFPKSHNLKGEWSGWGTALKPAHEPICVARKPLVGTVAANMQDFGTGAMNINGCRITTEDMLTGSGSPPLKYGGDNSRPFHQTAEPRGVNQSPLGRWPANVIHDGSDEVLTAFPNAPGQQRPSEDSQRTQQNVYGKYSVNGYGWNPRGDSGSAARFYYTAKADSWDRNEGLQGMPKQQGGMVSNTSGQHITRRDGGAPGPRENNHPTVKPTDLMRYLCRLVTQPGGIVLDPFMGSGSTRKAALQENLRFVGIELEDRYCEIASRRLPQDVLDFNQ